MDTILGIVIGVAICLLWFVFVVKRAEAQLEKDVNTLIEAIKAEAAKTTIAARVEQHDDMFYVYDVQDGMFLAQGATIAELREILEQRFQHKRIFVTEGEQHVIDRLRATEPKTDLETNHA